MGVGLHHLELDEHTRLVTETGVYLNQVLIEHIQCSKLRKLFSSYYGKFCVGKWPTKFHHKIYHKITLQH